jgi:hypothetical protein
VRTRGLAVIKPLLQLTLGGLICALLAVGAASRAEAQEEIEPYEFTVLPAGTNLALGYYAYGHDTDFNIARGPTVKNSGVEINLGVGRYVHLAEAFGYAAGFEIFQTFGSLSGAHVDGARVGSAFGAQNTALAAFIWPYVNQAAKTNVILVGFLFPPSGTYDSRSAINLGDNRTRGAVQIGITQGIGEHFGFDAALDAEFYGANDNEVPGDLRLTQNTSYRAQLWVNWRWTKAFSTSVGYEGIFGGSQYVNGVFNGSKTEMQRLRVNAALFVTPTLQTMLELNHDLHVVGGFKQEFGATLRVLYAF